MSKILLHFVVFGCIITLSKEKAENKRKLVAGAEVEKTFPAVKESRVLIPSQQPLPEYFSFRKTHIFLGQYIYPKDIEEGYDFLRIKTFIFKEKKQ